MSLAIFNWAIVGPVGFEDVPGGLFPRERPPPSPSLARVCAMADYVSAIPRWRWCKACCCSG